MLISLGGKRQQLSALEVLFETVFGGSSVLGGTVLHVFSLDCLLLLSIPYFILVDIVSFNWWVVTQKCKSLVRVINSEGEKLINVNNEMRYYSC